MGKPFDFEAAMAEWKDPAPPVFKGNSKKDPVVDAWLDQIKAGCSERKIPKEYWHLVGQRSLGSKAKARFNEVDQVMMKMHDGKYKWNWKRFKVAMKNMGWDMDPKKVEAYKVASKPSGAWWIIGKEKSDSESNPATNTEPKRVEPKRRQTSDTKPLPPTPTRRATMAAVPSPRRRGSTMSVTSESKTSQEVVSNQTPGGTVTTVTNVPTWLLNATTALDFLTTEHPKVMTTLSAVLITVGSLPAIPALAGGAGGAFLASHAVQAAGAIAVGLGNLLKAAQDNAGQKQPSIDGASIAEV